MLGNTLDYLNLKPNDVVDGIESDAFTLSFREQFEITKDINVTKGMTYYVSVRAMIENMPNVSDDLVIFYENEEINGKFVV